MALSPQSSSGTTSADALPDPSTVFTRIRIEALIRVAAELRGMLRDAPRDDPQVASILRDCDTLDEVARLLNQPPVKLEGLRVGISTTSTGDTDA